MGIMRKDLILAWCWWLSSVCLWQAATAQSTRDLRDFASTVTSFDLLCQRLSSMPDFLCECVSEIPHRAIECQSTEICSTACSATCGQFLFQVDYLGPDIAQLQACIAYSSSTQQQQQQPGNDDEYKDGCLTLAYDGEPTPTGCRLSFLTTKDDEAGGSLQGCERCTLCDDDPEHGVAVQTSCETVVPMATTSTCTPIQLDAFFPGFKQDDCSLVAATGPSGAFSRSYYWATACMAVATAWILGALII